MVLETNFRCNLNTLLYFMEKRKWETESCFSSYSLGCFPTFLGLRSVRCWVCPPAYLRKPSSLSLLRFSPQHSPLHWHCLQSFLPPEHPHRSSECSLWQWHFPLPSGAGHSCRSSICAFCRVVEGEMMALHFHLILYCKISNGKKSNSILHTAREMTQCYRKNASLWSLPHTHLTPERQRWHPSLLLPNSGARVIGQVASSLWLNFSTTSSNSNNTSSAFLNSL